MGVLQHRPLQQLSIYAGITTIMFANLIEDHKKLFQFNILRINNLVSKHIPNTLKRHRTHVNYKARCVEFCWKIYRIGLLQAMFLLFF